MSRPKVQSPQQAVAGEQMVRSAKAMCGLPESASSAQPAVSQAIGIATFTSKLFGVGRGLTAIKTGANAAKGAYAALTGWTARNTAVLVLRSGHRPRRPLRRTANPR